MGLFPPGTDDVIRWVLGLLAGLPVMGTVGLLLMARSPLGTSAFEHDYSQPGVEPEVGRAA
jgi:hypothetical protein